MTPRKTLVLSFHHLTWVYAEELLMTPYPKKAVTLLPYVLNTFKIYKNYVNNQCPSFKTTITI